MTGYITTEMFPQPIVLDDNQVVQLHANAIEGTGYSGYCCYSHRKNSLGQIVFIHTHDNDASSVTELFTTPLVVQWIASISGESSDITFIPYLMGENYNDLGSYWIERLGLFLYTLGVVRVEIEERDLGIPNAYLMAYLMQDLKRI